MKSETCALSSAVYIKSKIQNLKDYLKNHWTNTRLVCTHAEPKYSKENLKFWGKMNKFEKLVLSSAINTKKIKIQNSKLKGLPQQPPDLQY